MSPRTGGETDKFGNRYEGAWVVRHLLWILSGQGQSITVEDADPELERGSEFTFHNGEIEEVHQLKRQNRNINSWSVSSLQERGIWHDARHHIEAGRKFHFVSILPAKPLQEIADRAQRSQDLKSFVDQWLTSEELRDVFNQLAKSEIFGSPQKAWEVLQGFHISWHDERELIRTNAALSASYLEGASGHLAAAGLGDMVLHNLGVKLNQAAIEDRLERYGLYRASRNRSTSLFQKIRETSDSWAASVERELLTPAIARDEARSLTDAADGPRQLTLLMGAAGGGKSAVLHQFYCNIQTSNLPALAFRLDRLDHFSTTTDLGKALGFEMSPVAALASAAGNKKCVLLIDQVDAVSLVSGRMPRSFDAVANLAREAEAFPGMHVVLACRKFDVENDYRIRELVDGQRCTHVEVNPLSEAQVESAVESLGLSVSELDSRQRNLLRTPLNLVLLSHVTNDPEALRFKSTKQLFDGYWQRKLMDCSQRRSAVRFHKVVSTIAESMSSRQQLSVPATVLDAEDLTLDAGILVSENVLVRDGHKVAFFHESFFDYAFARVWVARDQTLVEFLLGSEQELFRRAQVRQVLTHLRETDNARFATEIRSLLANNEVRFHIKDVVLSLIPSLQDPSVAEWEAVESTLQENLAFSERLCRSLRTAPWFSRIDSEGVVEQWLDGTDAERSLALEVMTGGAIEHTDRIADLLSSLKDAPGYPSWLLQVANAAPVHESRRLFDLLLDSVRSGSYSSQNADFLWIVANEISSHRPDWAIELLFAHLSERPNALALDDSGKVAELTRRDYQLNQIVISSAESAPEKFCELILPYLLKVMSATEEPDRQGWPRLDRHFSNRLPGGGHEELEDSLLEATALAVRKVQNDPETSTPILQSLASDVHETAQWLLYGGLIKAGNTHARWAADLLLEGTERLICGYPRNSAVWRTRELICAICEFLPGDVLAALERVILDVRFPWEDGTSSRWHQFTLLSAFPDGQLSSDGRRRLGELRRRHGAEEPDQPQGITGGFIGSPIAPSAALHMSDDQWLSAMNKHSGDRRNWTNFTGGAHELASVLKEQAKQDPARFAGLAQRLTSSINPAYSEAVLMGFAEAAPLADPSAIFSAIRHISKLGNPATDRWLGYGLRRHLRQVPVDLVEILIGIAAAPPNQADERLIFEKSDRGPTLGESIWTSGFNSARGSSIEVLGDILRFDVDGSLTALVAPILKPLASDPAITIRSCVAHLLHASLRHARERSLQAFAELIKCEDGLLATRPFVGLLIAIGQDDFNLVQPVIVRMLSSAEPEVREVGGQFSTHAAVHWECGELLGDVLAGNDSHARKGAASVCASQLADVREPSLVRAAFTSFINDVDPIVQEAAASFPSAIRGRRLRPLQKPIKDLISSRTFPEATTQLLITLRDAPDRVDDLVFECADRFLAENGPAAADIRTGAAASAKYLGEIIIRAYAQSPSVGSRGKLLDVLDELLLIGAFGVSQLVLDTER
ncbi:NACHT domain-containing protein [Streptomyces sp. NPDC056361]|uniref:NACHT domain-containing protein n=1 Tax=Streptomyces sp. NPDC056361 TaxID=3345795 RepID=UPI0035D6EEBC